jgi:cyclophilin family peptidyl-prolyl cis-trans isomerase
MIIRRHRLAAGFVVGAVLLSACGDSTDEPAAAAESRTSSSVDDFDDGTESTSGTDVAPPAGGTTAGDPATGKPSIQLPDELPTDLIVTDLIEGSGEAIEVGDMISLDYVGVITADGTEFDNSYDTGQPLDFTLGAVSLIPGFEQGLVGLRQGGRRQIDMPASLAYGDAGAGGIIEPGDAITFVVDALSVTKPVPVTVPPMADPSDCPATDGSEPQQTEFEEYPPFCVDVTKTYTAEVTTNFGAFTIELDTDRAPLTVNSFVMLAWYGYFDDTECHRAIPGFVVQCGDPTATGTGGPGYSFPDELPSAGEYQIGSIAMANSGPNTNGSQFFIITGPDGAALPPQYSLFGQVVDGLDTTVTALDGVANPADNGVPPLEQILIESVTITVS